MGERLRVNQKVSLRANKWMGQVPRLKVIFDEMIVSL